MLRIGTHVDQQAPEDERLVFPIEEDAVRVATIRLPLNATFEDFARDVANTVTARTIVRGLAGRNPEDPEASA